MEMLLRTEKSGAIAICSLICSLAFTKEILKIQYVSYLMVLKRNELQ